MLSLRSLTVEGQLLPREGGEDGWDQPDVSTFMLRVFHVPIFSFNWHFSFIYLSSVVIGQNQEREQINKSISASFLLPFAKMNSILHGYCGV